MNSTVKEYCNQVGKRLHCLPSTRREILKGLEAELAELPAEERVSLQALEVHYGPVNQTVSDLQESVPAAERDSVTRRRKVLNTGILVLCMLLSLVLVGIFAVRTLHLPLSPKIAYYLPLRTSGGILVFTDREEANEALRILGSDTTIQPDQEGQQFRSCTIKTVMFFLLRDGSVQLGDSEITDISQLTPDLLHTAYECNVIYDNQNPGE